MAGDRSSEREDEALFAAWDLESDRSIESFRPSRVGAPGPHVKPGGRSSRPGEIEGVEDRSERRAGSAGGSPAVDLGAVPDTIEYRDGEGPRRASRPSGATVELPRPGEEVAGFRLIAELGRGAFARVFLAEEASLGGRHVALKISAAEGDEPQILARLQHAHIVPVHSVRDDPETGLRLLCMPFLGGANLAQVMEETHASRASNAKGRSLVEALDQLSRRFPSHVEESLAASRRPPQRPRSGSRTLSRDGHSLRIDPPAARSRGPAEAEPCDRPSRRFARLRGMLDRGAHRASSGRSGPEDDMEPSRRFLRGADVVRASVWIVARLAEGLEHAHSRGLLHRDLKPSNVLIAADGTPMLLDFNLAVDSDGADPGDETVARAMLGGTLPYMAPEHLDALDPEGTTPPDAVDERSDLYSLGLILFEMIAGEPAFEAVPRVGSSLQALRRMVEERRRPPPSLRARVPGVPPSLAALTAKCLDPDPSRRHRSAGDLAEDLRRFLDDLPMKHAPEPSLVERGRKWARRHPALSSSTSTALACTVLLGVTVVCAIQTYEAMQGLQARLKLRAFLHDALECRFLLNTFDEEDARLRRGVDLAASTLKAVGTEGSGPGWKGGASWVGRLTTDEQAAVRLAAADLVLEEVHARVVLAGRRGSEERRRETLNRAIARLDRLQASLDPAPSILFRQRSRYRAALGDGPGAEADRAEAESRIPSTCHEWTDLGMFLLSTGDVAGAEQALGRALALDVTSFWAWFGLGHCHFEQGRFAEAAGDFTACAVSRPEFAWGHFNRGLALARAGRPAEARDAYSRALAIDPDFIEARVDRGMVELELGDAAAAEADLRLGLGRGRRDRWVLAALGDALSRQDKTSEAERLYADLLSRSPRDAAVRTARGLVRLQYDPKGAKEDFAAVLADEPRHGMAHYGMARTIRESDPAAALDHLDRALQAEPDLFEAVELRALERARRGDRGALDDVERLVGRPTPNRLYNAACTLTILGRASGDEADLARAVDLLGRAILGGFPKEAAAADPDLAALRGRSDFAKVMDGSAVGR
ncbi:serine/threonine-protein kinase [Paludisphaera soli]|uniref:serine/threonine-protein kinase n=1 Tax=Paludisphaera soli TaxID=2712865 RepID=UPI0013ED7625|nr:serine/threonine-protein kinase [Paludisphaera soli]